MRDASYRVNVPRPQHIHSIDGCPIHAVHRVLDALLMTTLRILQPYHFGNADHDIHLGHLKRAADSCVAVYLDWGVLGKGQHGDKKNLGCSFLRANPGASQKRDELRDVCFDRVCVCVCVITDSGALFRLTIPSALSAVTLVECVTAFSTEKLEIQHCIVCTLDSRNSFLAARCRCS